MKHRPVSLLLLARSIVRRFHRCRTIVLLAAPFLLPACGESRATLVVLSDTTTATSPRVVVVLPFDPAELPAPGPAPAAIPPGPGGDSVRLALARRDSLLLADAAFQSTRAAANDAATALAPLDRRTDDYVRRYAAWRGVADSATALRGARDALASRLERLVSRLGDAAPELAGPRLVRSREAADSAARVAGRPVSHATLVNGVAEVELPPGEWWIAHATGDGSVRVPAVQRVVLAPGTGADTVQLR